MESSSPEAQLTAVADSARTGSSLRAWIVAHDDSKVFVILYISLALVLSIAIGLFWLFFLLAIHLAFELVRSQHEGWRGLSAIGQATWAVRLDIALCLFALVLALHLQLVFGVLGLHAAGRAGMAAQAGLRGARFAAWEKVIRGILLSADDAVQGARGLKAMRRRQAAEGATPEPLPEVAPPPPTRTPPQSSDEGSGGWSIGDYVTISLAAACTLLILLAPWLGHESMEAVITVLADELRPFPIR
jgi:hypothetical protein